MKLGYIALLLSISFLHAERMVRITANWVNILGSPSYQGQVIDQAKQDEIYIFQGRQGEWYKIVLPDQRTGWILEAAGQIETEVSPPSQTQPSIPYKPPSYTLAPEGVYAIPVLVRKVNPAIVTIYTYDSNNNSTGQGTGFFVSNNGEIITNRHVLQGAHTVQAKTASEEIFPVNSILAEDKEADLVKISIATPKRGFPIVTLAKKAPGVGERVVVIGSPMGYEGSVSEGIISGIRELPFIGERLQTTAPISPGSSGSPVFNLNGEVVGVIVSSRIEGQNLNFAIPVSRIRTLKPYGEISLSDWASEPHLTSFSNIRDFRGKFESLREYLASLPYEVQIMIPQDGIIAIVINFPSAFEKLYIANKTNELCARASAYFDNQIAIIVAAFLGNWETSIGGSFYDPTTNKVQWLWKSEIDRL